MALAKSCADLRNNYDESLKICQETEEERIERLISEHFDKHFNSFEEFQDDLAYHLEKATKEIEEGKGIPMEEAMAEMEARYHFNE